MEIAAEAATCELCARPSSAHCRRRAASKADCRLKKRDRRTAPWGGSGAPPEAAMISTASADAGESAAHETAVEEPLLSVMRRRTEIAMPRGATGRPSAAAASPAGGPVSASVGSGTRSCRRLAIVFKSRPRCPGTSRSKNDCASSGEVVVYQPERTAVNLFDYYRNRALNGQGSPDPGILAKLYGTFTSQADR